MKIAVIGAGAMGSIYGGHLSLNNEVYMIDKNLELIEKINKDGLKLYENNIDVIYRPNALVSTDDVGIVDLVILFVKSLYSKSALEDNKKIIGENTYIMTLQNGSGHEDIISSVVPNDHIIIGTTEDNGNIIDLGYVKRGGTGKTNIGMIEEDKTGILKKLKSCFDECGFNTLIHQNIQYLIWDKLFTNVSLSVVTGVLQVPIGYIAKDIYAWNLTKQLIKEAIGVANEMGLKFDETSIIERVKNISEASPEGLTSIYADLNNGRKTEVDSISGSVVRAAKKVGIKVHSHEFIVNMVHALENKNN